MTLAPMSVSRLVRTTLLLGCAGCVPLVLAAEEIQPDLEFLEYLGSWEESDKDWLLFSDDANPKVIVDGSQQSDAAVEAEASTELENES